MGNAHSKWYKSASKKQRNVYDQARKARGAYSLENQQIGDAEAQAIGEALQVNLALTELKLRVNQIGDAGARAIAGALGANRSLILLDLFRNQIGSAGAQAIGEALKTNNTLTKFYLSDNRLGDAGAREISEALKVNTKLAGIYLNENRIGDAGVQAIGEALRVNKTLTKLVLSHNQIGDAGARAIGDVLQVNRTLTSLVLWTNQIGPAGAQAIGRTLATNTTLTQLHLSKNQLGDAGAQALGEAMKVNRTLTQLDLHTNQIGDTGAQTIADALKVNSTLVEIFLDTNHIGDAGACAIGEALNVNRTLAELSLKENQVGDAGARAIGDALQVNKTLTKLNLQRNFISSHGLSALKQTKKSTCQLELADQRTAADRIGGGPDRVYEAVQMPSKGKQASATTTTTTAATQKQPEYAAPNAYEEMGEPPGQVIYDYACVNVAGRDSRYLREQLTILRNLGSGNFGDVSLGQVPTSALPPRARELFAASSPQSILVAVKSLHAKADDKARRDFESEAKMMARFVHPNVVQLLAALTESEPHLVLLEYVMYGDLRSLLKSSKEKSAMWSSNEQVYVMRQIALGMQYLGTLQFVHRDLAARNCLVGSGMVVKVADFGLSRELTDESDYYRMQTRGKLPVKWMAPESISFRRFTVQSDVWAFGVTAWECASYGDNPYGSLAGGQLFEYLQAGNRLPIPDDCSPKVYNIMRACWDADPDRRPSFADLAVQLQTLQDNSVVRDIGLMLVN
ncbi:tyrosine-protein kinase transforming protein Abl [Capsaspora owczarzaki ATCC 30864]|uniref:tyrosine-protein kinase transforming protein Abl n=1 Tax=Capsaspora owczarzaki (strain ATCC 30864) TaxID=595528 RepID=UPI0003522A88|nr:tyrosine-protein kinase transforming protein Abl [Capsaspora owczarzaki ATCC 30864]|eukprot:XP_004347670.2 tyrosine-protein kinase transforming protein Abl [Capsaspora owczarzaki ATCC 30864]